MKRFLIIVAILVAVAALAKRFASKLPSVDWEQRFEHMPDNAPPKWMFRNISAIRANTDRILELLERNNLAPAGGVTQAARDDARS